MADKFIQVEIVYATAGRQAVIPLRLARESTLEQAIMASGVLEQFPEIDLNKQKSGIFNQVCPLGKIVNDGDRIEIYRQLGQSPMDARRNRLKKT